MIWLNTCLDGWSSCSKPKQSYAISIYADFVYEIALIVE